MNRIALIVAAAAFVAGSLTASAQKTNTLPGWAWGGFTRPPGANPVIRPKPDTAFLDPMSKKHVAWEANYTFNPAAIVHNGNVVVLYRAEDKTGTGVGTRTSRIGYASSTDGIHFQRQNKPVLFPGDDSQKKYEWPGGCEDPRVAVTPDGLFVILYTQWNRDVPRLGVATSRDLLHWTKTGPAFLKAYNAKFCNVPHKSASILTRLQNGRQVIARINGKYWMYWGEQHVYAATSENLTDWTPLVDAKGELVQLMSPRKGYFDSDLTECGPPAILTDKGILLFYNGKNKSGTAGDPHYAPNTYCAGQALFDSKDPSKLIARLDAPFFRPMEAFEKTGQYAAGTVFIEGMAWFHEKWYLYYGCADSFVAVAVYDPAHPAKADPLP
ncbi:MAG: hypothetical protein JST42_21495 [Bacteroidetes bacterium]|nr:hypothetical protein [Bacteroidota bacterium]